MKNRKIRKSGFWRRMMAVLLAAVLVFGMVWETAPTSVLAQESVSENTPVDGETEQEEETETEPSGEDTKPAEGTDADEQEKPETTEPAEETDSEGQESGEEEEKEQESVSENDAPAESVAAPRRMMRAAVAQEDDTIIGGGEEAGWTLTADGRLTIKTDEGMTDWIENGRDANGKAVTSVVIQDVVKEIGDNAFLGCSSLKNITIPATVRHIGAEAFYECSSLGKVIVNRETPPVLDEGVFRGCLFVIDGLQGIHVPSGKADTYTQDVGWCNWGMYITDGTEATDNIAEGRDWTLAKDGRLTIKTDAGMDDWIEKGRETNKAAVKSVEIQDGVESIGKSAFDGCSNLTNITMSENVTAVGDYAFQGCSSLEHITLQGKVKSIGVYAFSGCSSLEHITLQGKVESIGVYAFNLCSELTGIEIPGSVTSIGEGAFFACSKLTDIELPEGVKDIGNYVFHSCGSLEDIRIPKNVTSIGLMAFYDCIKLKDITIPEAMKSIKNSAFSGCSGLTEVTLLGTEPPTLGTSVFEGCGFVTAKEKGIRVPGGYENAYKSAATWESWKEYITDGTPPAEEHEHDHATFTAWDRTDSLPETAGNYYLTKDVKLTDTWNVPVGIMNTTCLCLNGKTISAPGMESVIKIVDGTLKLYDCQGAGNITGGRCGVNVDGSLCTFQMYGGRINGNSGSLFGGGVKVENGTCEMYGGEISGNSAQEGGGVYARNGIFKMYGGKISGNSANMGGGVYGQGTTTFSMYGGEISGNNATPVGGGVLMLDDSCTFRVGDGAVISGNMVAGKANNVYLEKGQKIVVAQEKPLSGSASIGVTTQTEPTEGNPVDITGENSADYSKYFHSDNTDYTIVNGEGNVVQLAVKSQPHTHVLTPVDAKAATCTKDGNEAYYVCGGNDGCGMWFWDEAGTQEITDHNSVVISKTGHSYDTSTWGYQTAEGHAHQCVNCDGHDEVRAHTPGAAATETTPQTCTVCGYIIAAALGHTCSPQPVAKKEATCTTAGKQAYYHCEGCGKDYEDAEGTTLIADISAWGNIAALGHDWGEWKVTKKATATKPGEKERTCKRCEAKETEPIPATGGGSGGGNQGGGGNNSGGGDGGSGDNSGGSDGNNGGNNGGAGDSSGTGSGSTSPTNPKPGTPGASGTGQPRVKQEKKGNIQKEVRVEGNAAPDVEVATTLSDLADIVLTEAEKQQAAGGTNIRIVLDVKDASVTVSAADKTIVEMALNGSLAKGYTLGQYLDIDLYKVVGGSRSAITQTSRKITVTIRVPDSLKNTDATKARTFAVIRVHDGKAELLTDLDNEEDTITVETDRFSTYAVV